ncbi:MAG: 3-carboxy-cis,cis-muconate cycloisomerase [Aestuariivirga sp.]
MSFTYQQSQFLSLLLGDDEIAELFSTKADLAAMIQFENALAAAQAEIGIIPAKAAESIEVALTSFKPELKLLATGIARDGMAIPELVKQLRSVVSVSQADHLHFGATSQDVIDTSLSLRAKQAFALFDSRLDATARKFLQLGTQFGANDLVAHTRMQRALPIKVQNRIDNWLHGVSEAQAKASLCRFLVQLGGPVGTLNQFGENGQVLKTALANKLNLECVAQNWHSTRGVVVTIADACSHVTGALGKLGIDVCLMAQNELGEITLAGGGTSSAMHHKQNPVKAEALVTLAHFNATLISGMHQSIVHEQERSGAAWTLEWMLLPQMIVAAGAATRIANELLDSVTGMGAKS